MRMVVVDVGNTSTSIGLYENGRVSRVSRVKGGIKEEPERCAKALREAAHGEAVCGAVLGSVVPSVNADWTQLVQRELGGCRLLTVDATLPMDVTVDYPDPSSIGADRLAGACGGVRRYGAPLIVADFGTALTFDVVTPDRRYVGGAITPGQWFLFVEALALVWFVVQPSGVAALFPGPVFAAGTFCLFVGNFAFVYVNLLGCYKRRYDSLLLWNLLTPVYWMMMSYSGWRAFIQFFRNPFFWEKTQHGLVQKKTS